MEGNVEEKIAHLGFIQGVINRMANNSFLLKGWAITIVAAAFSIYEKKPDILWAAYIPVILFCLLDGYFFYQEKLYRKLYEKVSNDEGSINRFSLNATVVNQELNHQYFMLYIFTWAVLPIYTILLVIVTIVLFQPNPDLISDIKKCI